MALPGPARAAGKLLALFESDMPYALQLTPEGRVATLGHSPMRKDVRHPVTAHPKLDPATGGQ
jgi:carotenoid cleavage dioxygenase-like enzyme